MSWINICDTSLHDEFAPIVKGLFTMFLIFLIGFGVGRVSKKEKKK